MLELKRTLDARGHGVLEMPSGTGKTITLLALIIAYQMHSPIKRPLIYCSRTVQELEKALAELQRLMEYRTRQQVDGKAEPYLAIGLASRKNLCIHPDVSKERSGKVVDARCMNLTSPWARKEATSTCDFFEKLEAMEQDEWIAQGVYTLEDLKDYGEQQGTCPYYLARKLLRQANVIIYSYHYLLDPKVADLISKDLTKDAIVVFDEAHNIDNVCIESMSIDISRPTLDSSTRSLTVLSDHIQTIKKTSADKLENEYQRLLDGLKETTQNRAADLVMANPVLPDDILEESVPGNIRKAEHFVSFLRRFVEFLKTKLKVMHVVSETPLSFLMHLKEMTFIDQKPLRFCSERLSSLIRTLEIRNLEDFSSLQRVSNFATIVSTYLEGFLLIMEPYESVTSTIFNPTLHLCCLDASIAMKPVLDRFRSVIITSGTLSPLEMYPKILNFRNQLANIQSFQMTLSRNSFCPMIITRGSDQVAVSSKFEVRNDPAVVRNYGSMLVEFARVIPDGLVAFFPSYIYMEGIVAMWNDMRILDKVLEHKLIFIETPDAVETSFALENYRKACDNGRGAVLLSVARGKVAEGIDFDHNYGRAVIMFGIPYQYTESRILKARLEFMRDKYQIRENDFLSFDAIRQAAQCVGRVLRGKTDYGLMVFADKRFMRADKRNKLPQWISKNISEANTNLSTDMALSTAKRFLREMAQPYELTQKVGVSLWSEVDVARHFPPPLTVDNIADEMEIEDKAGK